MSIKDVNKTPEPELNLLSYRLREIEGNLEKNINKISDKIDTLIEQLNKHNIEQTQLKVKVDKLEEEFNKLRKEDAEIKKDVNQLKVSVAEKLGWGAFGGTVGAALIKMMGG